MTKLTAAQHDALCNAADSQDGLFYFAARRNPAGEQYLLIYGLIEEGYAYRDEAERKIKQARAGAYSEAAMAATVAGNFEAAEDHARSAVTELGDLTRTRLYITAKGQAAVAPVDLGTKPACSCPDVVTRGHQGDCGFSLYQDIRTQTTGCALCGEPYSAHRTASGNTPPYCMSTNSRTGDVFVGGGR